MPTSSMTSPDDVADDVAVDVADDVILHHNSLSIHFSRHNFNLLRVGAPLWTPFSLSRSRYPLLDYSEQITVTPESQYGPTQVG